MGTRLAGNFCGGTSYVFPGGLACPTGATGRECDWIDFWRIGICIHDFCSGIGRAETCSYVASGPRESMDARAPLAWAIVAAFNLVSWRIPFWRDADASADVAADCYRGERRLWRAAAEFYSKKNDGGYSTGNDLRRDFSCAEIVTRGGGPHR